MINAEFIIKIDQKSLVHLDDQRLTTPWQHKALTKLMGLTYKIVYKHGKENRVADALSRTSHAPDQEICYKVIARAVCSFTIRPL